jgi:hypothetical protein
VLACQYFAPDNTPDIDLFMVRCGFLLAPPTRGISADEHHLQPLYVCASAIRATVKEVSFQYQQTAEWPSLSDLSVSQVSPKKYSSNTSKPLWAVEKLGNEWSLSSIQPLWGITDNNTSRNLQSIWMVQAESLYLPAFDFGRSSVMDRVLGDSMVSHFVMRLLF